MSSDIGGNAQERANQSKSFDPAKPARYPNGRVFTDDVINYRVAFLKKNEAPPAGLKPHTDGLTEFPHLGTPHSK